MQPFAPFQIQSGRGTGLGAGAFGLQPLIEKLAVRVGISVPELLGRNARTANRFVCHPDDLFFDSMELTLTGHQGVIDPAAEIPWVAQAQLVQRKDNRPVSISGEPEQNDHDIIIRKPTVIPLISKETVIEKVGGFIEKPWALFLNMEIIRVVGDSALPAFAADIRFQVTVNFISQANDLRPLQLRTS